MKRFPVYDALIIGAGISGSTIASRLAQAGMKCLLLEAGHHYNRHSYPRNERDGNARLFWNGGMELNTSATMAILRPKVVGGGSIVNQALLDEFDDNAFSSWRERSGADVLRPETFAPVYADIRRELPNEKIDHAFDNGNARIFHEGLTACGYQTASLSRAQKGCRFEAGNDCIECLYGCRLDSKQSTPVAVLPKGFAAGLQLLSDCEVTQLLPGRDVQRVYARHKVFGALRFEAKRVVLASGAIGNSKLLLGSGFGARLPALGENFWSHPQYMMFGEYDQPIEAWRGPMQSWKTADPRFRAQGFKLENVFAPPVATAVLIPGIGARLTAQMKNIRHMASIEVAIRDVTPGRIRLDKSGRLQIHKELGAEDKKRVAAGKAVIREVFAKTGARRVLDG
ncbi:MAG: GMC family oxidoreductase N-terminal domain-containing protein, partial [Moraxellaceae bacterium]|nr:GMC family oxidoreductase N-terminal domain-containing protein [Moraxellaceae bacterium]